MCVRLGVMNMTARERIDSLRLSPVALYIMRDDSPEHIIEFFGDKPDSELKRDIEDFARDVFEDRKDIWRF